MDCNYRRVNSRTKLGNLKSETMGIEYNNGPQTPDYGYRLKVLVMEGPPELPPLHQEVQAVREAPQQRLGALRPVWLFFSLSWLHSQQDIYTSGWISPLSKHGQN